MEIKNNNKNKKIWKNKHVYNKKGSASSQKYPETIAKSNNYETSY